MEEIFIHKLLAVPMARVARKLAPLTCGTGHSLLGALPPNPHLCLNNLFLYCCIDDNTIYLLQLLANVFK
jgi:hypothetical protein